MARAIDSLGGDQRARSAGLMGVGLVGFGVKVRDGKEMAVRDHSF